MFLNPHRPGRLRTGPLGLVHNFFILPYIPASHSFVASDFGMWLTLGGDCVHPQGSADPASCRMGPKQFGSSRAPPTRPLRGLLLLEGSGTNDHICVWSVAPMCSGARVRPRLSQCQPQPVSGTHVMKMDKDDEPLFKHG